ncbi:hypothetical protein C5S53_06120 [Methanophagales archaeon]|nr:hypothetical protein C5S53_06120 [Methanophagales archaeon]
MYAWQRKSAMKVLMVVAVIVASAKQEEATIRRHSICLLGVAI